MHATPVTRHTTNGVELAYQLLMQALELDSADLAKAVAKQLLHDGIIINRTHETVLRFLPPYIIKKQHIDQLCQALDVALSKNDVALRKNTDASKASKSKAPRRKRPNAHA